MIAAVHALNAALCVLLLLLAGDPPSDALREALPALGVVRAAARTAARRRAR